jgi:hypothetical protein
MYAKLTVKGKPTSFRPSVSRGNRRDRGCQANAGMVKSMDVRPMTCANILLVVFHSVCLS